VFLSGLDYKTDEVIIERYFSRFGELIDILVNKDMRTGKRKGFGFIIFKDEEPASYLINVNSKHRIDSRTVICKSCVGKEKRNHLNQKSQGELVEQYSDAPFNLVRENSAKINSIAMRSTPVNRSFSNKSINNSTESLLNRVLLMSSDIYANHRRSNIHLRQTY